MNPIEITKFTHYISAQIDGKNMKLVRMYNAFEGDTLAIGRDERGIDRRFSVHWVQDTCTAELKPILVEM